MAYSGNCVISNYTQGRDSNRGGCAHSCRFEYSLDFGHDQEKIKAYFMSSKDLEGVRALEDFIKSGIDSLKVEGRMKSHLYAATITKVYREALDYYKKHGNFYSPKILEWEAELKKVSHRSYSSGSLLAKADANTIYNERENAHDQSFEMTGVVLNATQKEILMQVRNAFNIGDELEILPYQGDNFKFKVTSIQTVAGVEINRTKPSTVVRLIGEFPKLKELEVIRRPII
jgi:putative protease